MQRNFGVEKRRDGNSRLVVRQGRIQVNYTTPPVVEQVPEPMPPIRVQLLAWAVACAACGAIGFAWAWLVFGVLQ